MIRTSDHADPASLPAEFDGLARLAAQVCEAAFACVEMSGWGSARYGASDAAWLAVDTSHDALRACTARAAGVFEVPDTTRDARFQDSGYVRHAPGVRWYAGCALRAPDGELLGTLAVFDTVPRQLSGAAQRALASVAEQCVAYAELRARITELEFLCAAEPLNPAHLDDAVRARALLESAPIALFHADLKGRLTYVNPEFRRLCGLAPRHSPDDWIEGAVHPEDRARMAALWADFRRRPRALRFECRAGPVDGEEHRLSGNIVSLDSTGASGFLGTIEWAASAATPRGKTENITEMPGPRRGNSASG